MREQQLALNERLQPFLQQDQYSFVAPIDANLFNRFCRAANDIAPGNLFDMDVHRVLSNRNATRQALNIFLPETPIRIYVVTPDPNLHNFIQEQNIEDYCAQHNIDLDVNQ